MTQKLKLLTQALDELQNMQIAILAMIDAQKQIDHAPKQTDLRHYEVGQMLNEYKDFQQESLQEYVTAKGNHGSHMLAAQMCDRPDYLYNEGGKTDTAITPHNYNRKHNIDHSNGDAC